MNIAEGGARSRPSIGWTMESWAHVDTLAAEHPWRDVRVFEKLRRTEVNALWPRTGGLQTSSTAHRRNTETIKPRGRELGFR